MSYISEMNEDQIDTDQTVAAAKSAIAHLYDKEELFELLVLEGEIHRLIAHKKSQAAWEEAQKQFELFSK